MARTTVLVVVFDHMQKKPMCFQLNFGKYFLEQMVCLICLKNLSNWALSKFMVTWLMFDRIHWSLLIWMQHASLDMTFCTKNITRPVLQVCTMLCAYGWHWPACKWTQIKFNSSVWSQSDVMGFMWIYMSGHTKQIIQRIIQLPKILRNIYINKECRSK